MKILYYDCSSGISGDMNLAAMIDLGVPEDYLRSELMKINVEGWKLEVKRDHRHGIYGTRIDVIMTTEEKNHRHPSDIEKIIKKSSLSENVKDIASGIFREVALAESKVHGIAYEKVHFHEVGAIDSIIDIIGAAICLDSLGVDRVYASPLELGSGTVKCQHGILPVPAPATLEIVKDIPVHVGGVDFEATTPTGAAIIKATATFSGRLPRFTIKKSGYGIGHKEVPDRPNILRISIADVIEDEKLSGDTSLLVECNIDDMNPEWYGNLVNRLLETGASDVFYSTVTMKKGRPGTLVSVICHTEVLDQIKMILFTESTTIGVRVSEFEKFTLDRKFRKLETVVGNIVIKESYYKGKLVSVKPEYDDCLSASLENNITLKEVYCYVDEALKKEDGKGKD